MGDFVTPGLTRRQLISGAAALTAYATLQRAGLSAATAADPVPSDRLPYGGTWRDLVGVQGGIPARSGAADIYTTIQPYTGSGDTINRALAACPADKVVQLAPGVFNIQWTGSSDNAIQVLKDRVTLRGSLDSSGVPTTLINFTGSNTTIQIGNDRGWDIANAGQFTSIAISGGATRGSTSVTLASTPSGLVPGRLMCISGVQTSIIRGGGWSLWLQGTDPRPFTSFVRVTAVSGNTVSFTPAINADYLSNASPKVHYRGASSQSYLSGIENLDVGCGPASAPHTAAASGSYVKMYGTDSCWVKNCKFYYGSGGDHHIFPYCTFRTEIRHCEIHKIASNSSNAYAILALHSSGALIEDNYFHDLPNVMPMMGMNGSAFAYNYFNDEPYATPNWLSQIVFFHGSHNHYNLFEGNWVAAHYNDASDNSQFAHSRNNLFFRERMRGWDANGPKTANTVPFTCESHHDNIVVAGCVMGENGIQSNYSQIFNLDSTTASTIRRLSNYNTVNDAVPSSEALPAGSALIASYLYSGKPAYFGSLPWPWCDSSNFGQSNNPASLPAGFRAVNGRDPVGYTPAAPTNLRITG
jgi:hypothetical protein